MSLSFLPRANASPVTPSQIEILDGDTIRVAGETFGLVAGEEILTEFRVCWKTLDVTRMPHKPGFSYHKVGAQGPNRALVRRVLAGFDELRDLSPQVREQLMTDLLASVYRARGGVKARKRHKSNKALGKHIFMADVGRALEQAGRPVKRWQRHGEGRGESFYYRLAHALGGIFGLRLPQDLNPLALRAAQIQYGVLSPAMAAEQDAELAAQRRRRLRKVWGDHLVDPPQSCEELASAYLGFPF